MFAPSTDAKWTSRGQKAFHWITPNGSRLMNQESRRKRQLPAGLENIKIQRKNNTIISPRPLSIVQYDQMIHIISVILYDYVYPPIIFFCNPDHEPILLIFDFGEKCARGLAAAVGQVRLDNQTRSSQNCRRLVRFSEFGLQSNSTYIIM